MKSIGSAVVLAGGVAAIVPLAAQSAAAPVVNRIVIEPESVYGGPVDSLFWYQRLANAIHVTTQPWIIRRELLFDAGDPYDSALVAETARNLRGLGVFRVVDIDSVRVGSDLSVWVRTADGWSTKPRFTLSGTGSEATYSIGFREENLLGTATQVGALFGHDPDRDRLGFSVSTPHTLGSHLLTTLDYENLSDGERGTWAVQPHHTQLSSRLTFRLDGEAGTMRLLRFREGALADEFHRRLVRATGFLGWAPMAGPRGYLRLLAGGQIRRDDIIAGDSASFPHTVTGAVGVGAEFRHARFIVVDHYNTFARSEDVDLSSTVQLVWWVAPSRLGYARTGSGPSLRAQTGGVWGQSFFRLAFEGHSILRGGRADSGAVQVSSTLVVKELPRQTFIAHGVIGAQRAPIPGAEFDLGLVRGPRAFGAHAFTGTRMAWIMGEHRVYLVDDWLGLLGLGAAVFADYGGAWYAGERRRLGGDVGFGLRIGASRALRSEVARLDLAYRFGDGVSGNRWTVIFGRGVSF